MSQDIKDVDKGIYNELLLDALDTDGDGTAEIFTIGQAFEGNNFQIYKHAQHANGRISRWKFIIIHCGYLNFDRSKFKKAVILARGLGTRLRAEFFRHEFNFEQAKIASLGIKTLMPVVGDKTLLEFIFENLSKAGFSEFCLVIGRRASGDSRFLRFVELQDFLCNSRKTARHGRCNSGGGKIFGDEIFLVVNSDNLYPFNALRELRELNQTGFVAFSRKGLIEKSNISEDKINKFATVELDKMEV